MPQLTEARVENAAIEWFTSLAHKVASGADISAGAEGEQRESHEDVVLQPRLAASLRKINSHLLEDAIEHAVRVVTRPPEPTLAQKNRWSHRLQTDGIDVGYRTKSGVARGATAFFAAQDRSRPLMGSDGDLTHVCFTTPHNDRFTRCRSIESAVWILEQIDAAEPSVLSELCSSGFRLRIASVPRCEADSHGDGRAA